MAAVAASSSSTSLLKRSKSDLENELVQIEPMGSYVFAPEIDGMRITVQWVAKQQGINCDLELNALMYDERVSPLMISSVLM